jgi:hypothetical protein
LNRKLEASLQPIVELEQMNAEDTKYIHNKDIEEINFQKKKIAFYEEIFPHEFPSSSRWRVETVFNNDTSEARYYHDSKAIVVSSNNTHNDGNNNIAIIQSPNDDKKGIMESYLNDLIDKKNNKNLKPHNRTVESASTDPSLIIHGKNDQNGENENGKTDKNDKSESSSLSSPNNSSSLITDINTEVNIDPNVRSDINVSSDPNVSSDLTSNSTIHIPQVAMPIETNTDTNIIDNPVNDSKVIHNIKDDIDPNTTLNIDSQSIPISTTPVSPDHPDPIPIPSTDNPDNIDNTDSVLTPNLPVSDTANMSPHTPYESDVIDKALLILLYLIGLVIAFIIIKRIYIIWLYHSIKNTVFSNREL